ncbi:MAG: hypothetical protein OSB65_02375 [Roseibacillus sp.]|jgi:NifU-like protein involved in Fe-S cluster formation|nr:hypothetical protein [Roseibacillus sp.]|tara:strand:- start:1040 stop:1180 length:141 start_codon:yes stop_codon:yes gene_type:complete
MNLLLFPAQIACTILAAMVTLQAAEDSKDARQEGNRLTILMVEGSG